MVLGPGRRGSAVIVAVALDVAAVSLPFITICPDDTERFSQGSPDNGVDQSRRDAVIALDVAVEVVDLGVGPN